MSKQALQLPNVFRFFTAISVEGFSEKNDNLFKTVEIN